MSRQGKGLGKAMPLVLAAGAAAAISKYRLQEEPLLAYKRIKHRLLSARPPKKATGPFNWEAFAARCDATIRVEIQNGVRYTETRVRGEDAPTRTLMRDGGVTPGLAAAAALSPISIPQNVIDICQSPGRKHIGLGFGPSDTSDFVWIVKDDWGIPQDSMYILFDVDAPQVSWAKQLEIWTGNRNFLSVRLRAEMISVPFGTGVICTGPSDATDYANSCSNGQSVLIARPSMDQMWFRKPVGLFAQWIDVGFLDNSVWAAFGGKRARFIWQYD
jgi:hypothetical protein